MERPFHSISPFSLARRAGGCGRNRTAGPEAPATRRLPVLILFLFWLASLFSQTPHPAFRHYTTDHGLPSPETYDVLQDRRGYTWISTDNGVARFNGYEFKNFGPEQGLKNNVVFQLYEDHRGYIWMVTMSENLYYYDYAQDSILAYRHNSIIQKYDILSRGGPGFFVDSAGTIFRSLYGVGILQVDTFGQHRRIYAPGQGGLDIVSFGRQTLLYFEPYLQRDWLERREVRDEYPYHFSLDRGKTYQTRWVPYESSASGAQYFLDLDDGRRIIHQNQYLHYFIADQYQWTVKLPYEVSIIHHHHDGRLYLGCRSGEGVQVYENLEAIRRRQPPVQVFLQGNTISRIYEDPNRGLWITTIENGVYYCPNPEVNVFDTEAGLPEDHVTSLACRSDERLFVGFRQGSVCLLDLRQGIFPVVTSQQQDKEIFALHYDPVQKSLWKGSVSLSRHSPIAWNQAFNINATRQVIRRNTPGHKNFKIKDRRLWASSFNGFGRINLDNGEMEIDSWNFGLQQRTLVAFEDLAGRIWIGNLQGLFEFKDNRLVRPEARHPAFSLRVEDIDQLADSTLVIGTKGEGVLLWKGDQVIQLSKSSGLTTSMVERVHVDPEQNIWVGTLNGLNRITRHGADSFTVMPLTLADGLPSNEINHITSHNGQTWVATTRGLVRIPPDEKQPPITPSPILERVKVNNRIVSAKEVPSLPHTQNNLQFTFLAINFAMQGNIRYRYRLLPIQEWQTSTDRTTTYSQLGPGRYTFQVQAANQAGQWSDTTEWSFQIQLPFWLSLWFILPVSLLLLGSVVVYYRYRIRQERREAHFQRIVANLATERSAREREKARMEREMLDLKQSALRAQINPHFIFNTLSSIEDLILNGDRTNATRYLARFAKLIRAALQASLQNKVSLEEDIEMLQHYLSLEKIRFDNGFSYTLEMAPDIDPFALQVPPMLAQPYVENAILHGLVDARGDEHIHLRYWLEQDYLLIRITDNGIGIEEAQKRKGADSLQRSIGMTLTEKRLELLAHNDKTEKVNVRELRSKDGKVEGTEVTVRVRISDPPY